MAKRKLNVAMIGYDFMGRARSNSWRRVARFFADAVARERLGLAEQATSWHRALSRADIDVVDICTPGDSHDQIAVELAKQIIDREAS